MLLFDETERNIGSSPSNSKLNTNVALDQAAAGQASTAVSFDGTD